MSAHEWSTQPGLVTLGWVLAAATVVWEALATGPTDRVFIAVLILVLVTASTLGTLLRPRLRADNTGVAVRSLGGSRHWGWAEVDVRVTRQQRLGRTVELLELDVPEDPRATGGLVILTRLDLGADPHTVAEQLTELRR